MKTKQIIFGSIVLVVAAAAAWLLLLRPEQISQDSLTDSFGTHKAAFNTVADYLTENKIPAEITGFFTVDENYGVPRVGDDAYADFVVAVEELLSRDCEKILSDGSTVEFVYPSTGGAFNKLYGAVIYNGKASVDGKITVALNREGWHLYLAQGVTER